MSRVVKNFRRWRPRARWKMLAPCITVLSTSKNAAEVASAGVTSAVSTSAAAAAASPASVERCWRFSGRRLLSGGGVTSRSVDPGGGRRRPSRTCGRILVMPATSPAMHDLADLLTEAAAESPDRLAVVEAGGRSLTWADLDDEVGRVATGLAAAGMVAGYRVLLAVGNRIEFVTTYLGILRAQLVAVPVNPRATVGELARLIADSGSRLVVTDPDTAGAVRDAVALVVRAVDGELAEEIGEMDAGLVARAVKPRVVVIDAELLPGEHSYDELRSHEARAIPQIQDPEKLAALLYTSGTSGLPRAAMLTHRALLANIDQVAQVRPPMIHGDDVVLGVLPLFHVYGLNAVLGGVLRHRAKLVLADRFDPQGTLDLIEDEACSVVPVAPPVFAHWRTVDAREERLGPVRLIRCGSAPLAAHGIAE